MGIRYYAYAFDSDQTEHALADPEAFLGSDPLADAWGFEPHASFARPTFEQAVPKHDMLYLDKLWHDLQRVTSPPRDGTPPRPAYRMFEGQVTLTELGWWAWTRALTPAEMAPIARDLAALEGELHADPPCLAGLVSPRPQDLLDFVRRARTFVDGLVEDGRGMVYMIG